MQQLLILVPIGYLKFLNQEIISDELESHGFFAEICEKPDLQSVKVLSLTISNKTGGEIAYVSPEITLIVLDVILLSVIPDSVNVIIHGQEYRFKNREIANKWTSFLNNKNRFKVVIV